MLITTVISSALIGFINHKFNLYIQGFAIMWVVPIGAMLVGSLAGSGLWLSRKFEKKPIKSWFLVAGALAGLLGFFGSMYADFKIAEYQFRTKSQAVIEKLSAAEKKKLDQELTFFNFVKRTHNNTKINLSHHGRQISSIDNSFLSIIAFWSSVLGSVFAGWLVASMTIGDRTKDKRTGEYRDLKYVAILEFKKYQELDELIKKSTNLAKDLAKFLLDHRDKKELSSAVHTTVKVLKSRSKGDGQITAVSFKNGGKNIVQDKHFEYDLSAAEMTEIMSAILSIDSKERF